MSKEHVLEHYKHPFGRQVPIEDAQLLKGEFSNSICGDLVTVWLDVSKDMIRLVRWVGSGCCFSQAASSMLAEHLEGKTLKEGAAFGPDDMLDLFQEEVDTNRIECVMVAYNAVQNALETR